VVTEALSREVRDPRIGLVTLTRVETSPDLSHARIFVAFPADLSPADQARAQSGLESAAGFLRGRVARALATRVTPELHFVIDRGAEHAARINALLAELRPEGED
jgi:ribosome-binding factor A